MVWDVITYNGEEDMLDLRLNILDKFVDKFVIVEAKSTFSGKKKPLYFSQQEQSFRPWWRKIDYHIIDERYTQSEITLAETSPNTVGAKHWKTEFLQKESIKEALRKCGDDDLVYIGDVDEIWTPYYDGRPEKLKLKVYAYWLNNRSNEEFWGTLVAKWGQIKDKCLNHVRSDTSIRSKDYHGWHFTSMGGYEEVKRKLDNSYTEESYYTPEVQQMLKSRLDAGVDYLGRQFEFSTDATEWPLYLKENRLKYRHLCNTYQQ